MDDEWCEENGANTTQAWSIEQDIKVTTERLKSSRILQEQVNRDTYWL